MKLRLSLLIIAVAVLASVSVVTANRGVSEGRARSAKRKRPFAGAPVNAKSYRSSGLHKIIVSNDDTQAIADARTVIRAVAANLRRVMSAPRDLSAGAGRNRARLGCGRAALRIFIDY